MMLKICLLSLLILLIVDVIDAPSTLPPNVIAIERRNIPKSASALQVLKLFPNLKIDLEKLLSQLT
jgi:hypothetical protein